MIDLSFYISKFSRSSPAMTGVTFLRMGTNIGMPGIVRNLGIQVCSTADRTATICVYVCVFF